MKIRMMSAAVAGAVCMNVAAFAQDETLLLRDPAISAQKIAFVYAGDLWTANRDGSNPRRLTSSPVDETNPVFSPDGSMIAYTANFENNHDVYVIATAGGQPTRLTWRSGNDVALDWTPDGRAVAFASQRETNHGRSAQLYHVSVNGGLPVKQMAARIFRGQYNASGSRFETGFQVYDIKMAASATLSTLSAVMRWRTRLFMATCPAGPAGSSGVLPTAPPPSGS